MLDSKHLDVEKSSYINVCEWDMLYEVLWVLKVEKHYVKTSSFTINELINTKVEIPKKIGLLYNSNFMAT